MKASSLFSSVIALHWFEKFLPFSIISLTNNSRSRAFLSCRTALDFTRKLRKTRNYQSSKNQPQVVQITTHLINNFHVVPSRVWSMPFTTIAMSSRSWLTIKNKKKLLKFKRWGNFKKNEQYASCWHMISQLQSNLSWQKLLADQLKFALTFIC